MKNHSRCRSAALALVSVAGLVGSTTHAAENIDLLIRSATVVDVRSGKQEASRSIAVRGGDIMAIGDAAIAGRYRAERTVDVGGRFVIPGLWDMHVHFGGGDALIAENRALLPLYVAHGVTAVRDAAADISPSVLEWRDAVASGAMLGPTIFTSEPKLEGPIETCINDLQVHKGSSACFQNAAMSVRRCWMERRRLRAWCVSSPNVRAQKLPSSCCLS